MYATYQQWKSQMVGIMEKDIFWEHIQNPVSDGAGNTLIDQTDEKLYISGPPVDDGKVTVVYARGGISRIEEVVHSRASGWIESWSIATAMLALGRIRAKYRAGGLNFEVDGPDLVADAKERLQALGESLKDIDYNFQVMR